MRVLFITKLFGRQVTSDLLKWKHISLFQKKPLAEKPEVLNFLRILVT